MRPGSYYGSVPFGRDLNKTLNMTEREVELLTTAQGLLQLKIMLSPGISCALLLGA